MNNSLNNKVVLLTGGAGKIGSKMVQELIRNGVKGVAIVDISMKAGEKIVEDVDDQQTIFIEADITNSEELKGAFKKTVETYHQLDIVINNAGLMDEMQWKHTIAVNLTALIEGTYLAMEKYLPQFKSTHEGTIVNVASLLGFGFLETIPVYCATKHAVVGLGKALGTDLFYKKYKVRLLTLCPGSVNTPLLTSVHKNRCFFPDRMVEEFETLKSVIQTPENVAKALIDVVQKGKHGSMWVVESNQPAYEVEAPTAQSLITK